ncbi:PadR family transcriptional regulator [Raoultibacter massiliensis]|uniref:PadR family transcriptional regulator n=1 Tax=Raoultibacter massiliensis TaxID=1852371 RepID=A0ABV1J9W3_9ACTN
MLRGDCSGNEARKPCCRRRGGGGGALVEPAALAALLYAGGYGYDLRRTILEMSDGEVDTDVGGLYRTLRRMEEEGSVVSRWCEDGSGPRRREYELTVQGVELAEQWIDALRSRERLDGLLASMLEDGLTHLEEKRSDGPKDDTGADPGKEG